MESIREDTMTVGARAGAERRESPKVQVLPEVSRCRPRAASMRLSPAEVNRADGEADPLGDLDPGTGLGVVLGLALEGALELTAADFGDIRMFDGAGQLRLVAQAGFGPEYLHRFATVHDEHATSRRAATLGAQVTVDDVLADEDSMPLREVAVASGFRAVQSTPLIDHEGSVVGVVSTHFRSPGGRPQGDLRAMRTYGLLAGEAVAQARDWGRVGVEPSEREAVLRAWPRLVEHLDRTEQAMAKVAQDTVNLVFSASMKLADAQGECASRFARDQIADAIAEMDSAITQIRDAAASASRTWELDLGPAR